MTVTYRLSFPEPHVHLVGIELAIDGELGGSFELTLPAWCPGSYLIRDYARMVRDLEVEVDGRSARVVKTDKQTWRIEAGGDRVRARYRIYGHDLSVRTNHIDGTHAFLHGPATFLHVPALRDREVSVRVELPHGRGWTVATGLRRAGEAYTAAGIDELYDCPIHAGVAATREIEAAGKPARIAVWGDLDPGARRTIDDLASDVGAIIESHAARFGGVPYEHYTFILMLTANGYGGLEHRNSSANIATPLALSSDKAYQDLLELLSHEYFHTWNGKRIYPEAFARFDYTREAYTRCLWVVEGITSHYDRMTVRQAGKLPLKRYFEKLADEWGRLLATPGRARQSLEEASFDAWIKLYKPDESNLNTTVSYYLKGGLVALAMDLAIRRRSRGERSLDDVVRALWRDHGAVGRPYPEDVQPLFEAAAGVPLGDLFDSCVRGRQDPDLAGELSAVGLELRESWDRQGEADEAPCWLGLVLAPGGGARVAGVFDDSPAAAAGISPGDEIIAMAGTRIASESDLRGRLRSWRAGSQVELALFRRDRLLEVGVELAPAPPNKIEIAVTAGASEEAKRAFEAWLGTPLPDPGVLGSAVQARWT